MWFMWFMIRQKKKQEKAKRVPDYGIETRDTPSFSLITKDSKRSLRKKKKRTVERKKIWREGRKGPSKAQETNQTTVKGSQGRFQPPNRARMARELN